jgi:pyruvate kinase
MLKMIHNIRTVEKRVNKSIPIIQDLQGPKIRVGILPPEGIKLIKGKNYIFVGGDNYDGKNIPIPVKEVIDEIHVGDCLLLADGYLKIKVVRKFKNGKNGFEAKVLYGGTLTSRKGIIGENKTFSLSSLSPKDYRDIDWGYANKIKFAYIAFSFVKSAQDVETLRSYLKKKHKDEQTKIVVKFETADAVKNMEEIVIAADSIMVARGDLGLEVPIQFLPGIQKKLIELCCKHKKPVIVATQMLSSMMTSPIPNRSEVTDIANAVYDKTDAIMLSDETAVGKNAINSVRMFTKIIKETEKYQKKHQSYDTTFLQTYKTKGELSKIVKSVLFMAQSIKAKHIIILSAHGYTAGVFSSFRSFLPQVVITNNHLTESQLRLRWGINEIILTDRLNVSKTINLIKKKYQYKTGEKVILCNIQKNIEDRQHDTFIEIIKF